MRKKKFPDTSVEKNSILESNNQYQGQLDCPDTTFSTKGDEAVINLLDDIPEPEALLYINTIMALSLGNISVSGGKQKSRKTFFQIMLIDASLLGRWGCLQGVFKEDSKVLLFDMNGEDSCIEDSEAYLFYTLSSWRIFSIYSPFFQP